MIIDDLEALRDILRDLALAGYRIDIDNTEVMRVWFRALQSFGLSDIREAVDKLLRGHEKATVKPNDVIHAIYDIRRERSKAGRQQAEEAKPETTEQMLRRRGLPWTVEQYKTHRSRLEHAMIMRLRRATKDEILGWLRERKDIDQAGKSTVVDVPDGLLADEIKMASGWFEK